MPRREDTLDHKIGYLLVAQLSFAVSVTWFLSSKTQDIVPHDWNTMAWSNFAGAPRISRFIQEREIMLFIGKPKGRSMMISNATNPLKESRKNLY